MKEWFAFKSGEDMQVLAFDPSDPLNRRMAHVWCALLQASGWFVVIK
jgi:hypothetical protein